MRVESCDLEAKKVWIFIIYMIFSEHKVYFESFLSFANWFKKNKYLRRFRYELDHRFNCFFSPSLRSELGIPRIPKSKEEEWDRVKKLEKLRHAKEREDWDWIGKVKMRATGLRARRGGVT